MVGTTNMTARTIILKTIYDQYNYVQQVFDGKIAIQDKTITVQNLTGHRLQLYTITGVLINEVEITAYKISITAPATGCYILRIENDTTTISKLLIR